MVGSVGTVWHKQQSCFSQITLCLSDGVLIWLTVKSLAESTTFGSHPWAFSHAGCFAFLPFLFLFIMHRGCLATPASCGVIDSRWDLYITDRQLTRGGQWCVSWLWPGMCVLNSHGPPAGWHKADGSLRAVFLIGSAPRRAMHAIVSFSFLFCHGEGGWVKRKKERRNNEREKEREREREREDVLKCDSCAKNSWFLPPPKHPAAAARLDRLWHQNSDMQHRNWMSDSGKTD